MPAGRMVSDMDLHSNVMTTLDVGTAFEDEDEDEGASNARVETRVGIMVVGLADGPSFSQASGMEWRRCSQRGGLDILV